MPTQIFLFGAIIAIFFGVSLTCALFFSIEILSFLSAICVKFSSIGTITASRDIVLLVLLLSIILSSTLTPMDFAASCTAGVLWKPAIDVSSFALLIKSAIVMSILKKEKTAKITPTRKTGTKNKAKIL